MKTNINYWMKTFLSALLISFWIIGFSQSIDERLFENYDQFSEKSIDKRRIKPDLIYKLTKRISRNKKFSTEQLGSSIEGRPINLVSTGKGKIDILLWSQMHGDESTATMAIFDIFNLLKKGHQFESEIDQLLQKVTLHFIPMLNPDGAQQYKRRNALGVDLNRDALRLQSPESRILKNTRDRINPKFGFNLHDQSRYYTVGYTSKPATISVLAPAYNYAKEINEVRANAMKVIIDMNNVIQKYAPGQVGRYSDEFEPRAFGDNIQKWGTSAILVESGGQYNDREKQTIRKLNFVAIMSAIFSIANNEYTQNNLSEYDKIPHNNRRLTDFKIHNLTYNKDSIDYQLDVAINLGEVEDSEHENFYLRGSIVDLGDLSTTYGYDEFDATGMHYVAPKVHNKIFQNIRDLKNFDAIKALKDGAAYVKVKDLSKAKRFTSFPINIVNEGFTPRKGLYLGSRANFFLSKDGIIKAAVINGIFRDLVNPDKLVGNSLIMK